MAGVEHIYVYENWKVIEESQLEHYIPYIKKGLVSFHSVPYFGSDFQSYMFSQLSSYSQCYCRYREETTWQITLDVDEYPLMLENLKPNWLIDFIREGRRSRPGVTHWIFKTWFFGNMQSDGSFTHSHTKSDEYSFLIDSYKYRAEAPVSGTREKTVYLVSEMRSLSVHQAFGNGISVRLDPQKSRLNHYWGYRCSKSCNIYDYSVKNLADHLRDRKRKNLSGCFR